MKNKAGHLCLSPTCHGFGDFLKVRDFPLANLLDNAALSLNPGSRSTTTGGLFSESNPALAFCFFDWFKRTFHDESKCLGSAK
jgi:hypothetical protein